MSTQLRSVPGTNLQQTRFFGGQQRGVCVQVSQPTKRTKTEVDQFFDCLQLNREQAKALAVELMLFAESREVPEF
tara:strand:+ start:71 stop:295 length:225 start_codon:yes stop_codon:yes gene_type:complete